MQRTMFISTLKHTSTLKRCLSLVECYLRSCLDFNGYFEYCKWKNTRANHPYKMQMKSAKFLTPLSAPSLWKSSKTGTIYQTTSLLMKSDCPTFWVCKMGILFFQPQTNHMIMSVDWVSHLGGLEFFPQENFEILMFWKKISSVLRGQLCPKCSLNHTNRLPFFA